MDQVIAAFGIDGRLIIIQIFNFVILMVALSYLLYKPILKVLAERKEKVLQGIKDADDAAKALAEASEQKRTILTTANQEAIAVADRAKEYAASKANEIVAEAQSKAEQVAKEAEARGQEIKAKAVKESEAEIAKLAILTAEKILKEKSA